MGVVQDLVATSSALYWLTIPGTASGDPTTVTPTRYDLTSDRMIRGTPLSGTIGYPSLTVTGGWVWVALQVGAQMRLAQFNPSTLVVQADQLLPVTNDDSSYSLDPVLTATVSDPLWVADGTGMWSFNPSTGAVETERDTGIEIDSLSTDPTGALLWPPPTVGCGCPTARGWPGQRWNCPAGI
jgi:hypothetical protein